MTSFGEQTCFTLFPDEATAKSFLGLVRGAERCFCLTLRTLCFDEFGGECFDVCCGCCFHVVTLARYQRLDALLLEISSQSPNDHPAEADALIANLGPLTARAVAGRARPEDEPRSFRRWFVLRRRTAERHRSTSNCEAFERAWTCRRPEGCGRALPWIR